MANEFKVTNSQVNVSDKNSGIQLDVEAVEQTVTGKALEVSKIDSSEEWKTIDCIESAFQQLESLSTEFSNQISAVSNYLSGIKSISNVEPPAVPSVNDDLEMKTAATPLSLYGSVSALATSAVETVSSVISSINSVNVKNDYGTGDNLQSLSNVIDNESQDKSLSNLEKEYHVKSSSNVDKDYQDNTSSNIDKDYQDNTSSNTEKDYQDNTSSDIDKDYQDNSSSNDENNTTNEDDVEVLEEEVIDSFNDKDSVADFLRSKGYHVDDDAEYIILEQGDGFYRVEKTNPDGTIQEILYDKDNPNGLIEKEYDPSNDSNISTVGTSDDEIADNLSSKQTDDEIIDNISYKITDDESYKLKNDESTYFDGEIKIENVEDNGNYYHVTELSDDGVFSDIGDIKKQEEIQNNAILSGLSFSEGTMSSDHGDDSQFDSWQ